MFTRLGVEHRGGQHDRGLQHDGGDVVEQRRRGGGEPPRGPAQRGDGLVDLGLRPRGGGLLGVLQAVGLLLRAQRRGLVAAGPALGVPDGPGADPLLVRLAGAAGERREPAVLSRRSHRRPLHVAA
ncbi:hypothetical protein GCM10025868_41500 [Angustibacter aerolatus]|uniref:Uncharacterized protein n=1 Tax=Angustibacter aerolatus TaxID=1162965 RepID=A0ABQ6JQB3_9ACTN|nr:hypothetical protein [Angustibacter aerolatus]GMA88900.1 hypothetical protein GCM10025868_41500 [Angustibacter aerolatus]